MPYLLATPHYIIVCPMYQASFRFVVKERLNKGRKILNLRPDDYKPTALPTELPQHILSTLYNFITV